MWGPEMGTTGGTIQTRDESIRVLHVDDEPDFAEMAATFLQGEDERFEVETMRNAKQGLEGLATDEYDCVVSDYNMPGRDGIEFLETVRDERPNLPFILFAGKGSEAVASRAISAGVTDYLQKETGTDQYTVLANRIQNAVSRRRAEHERQRHLEAIETAQDGISVLDSDGHYLYVNEAFADLHGYDSEALIGDHWQLVYRDEDVPTVRDEILPEVERTGSWRGETTSLRSDGTTVDVDHSLVRTETGELVCTVRDISARKERQRELHQSRARLEALFENSPDMINIHDTDGNIVLPNPRLCERTGYDASELAEMKVWELDRAIAPDEAYDLWDGMELGERRRLEGQYRRQDGSTFPVEVHVRRLGLEGEERFVTVARDITDRKQRQRELERYERLVEHLPVGVFRTTTDGDILSMNGTLVEIYDAESRDRIRDVGARSLYADEEDRQRLLDQLRREGTVEDELLRVETVTGESRWVRTTLSLVEEHGDHRLDGIVQDVTDRREQVLRHRRAETIFDHTQDALFLIDIGDERTCRVQQVNRAYEEMTGLSTADLRGRTPREILGEREGADVEARYQECLDRREPIEYDETLTVDGEVRSWHTRLAPVIEDDRVVQLVGATRDVTERREHEQERELAETLFDHAEECQFVFDVTDDAFELRHANDYYRRNIGLPSDDPVTGQTPTDLFGDADGQEVRDRYRECVDTRDSITYTVEVSRPENGTIYRTILTPVITGDEVTHIVGTARDITDSKRRERRLERQNRRLEEFARVVSHDLRNPLRVADGRLELIREECESDYVEDVAGALDRMDTLIDDLLALARHGEPVTETESVDLAGLLGDCWQNVETDEAAVEISLDRTVEANRSRLAQLCENLIRNAVEHGGGEVAITVGGLDGGFYVEDDGPGIPEDERTDVFDAGYSSRTGGTGFGLSIVERVVEAHGWDIRVTEATGGGARFEITGLGTVAG